jgi:hypothetical protein
LVEKAKKEDPNFERYARGEIDRILGKKVAERGEPSTFDAALRKHFINLIEAR